MDSAGIILVGAGAWGARYAAKVVATADARLLAVVDADLSRAREAVEKSGAAALATTSLEEAMARSPQGAIVAVPARAHADVARPLLQAGIGVLMEKPFAATLEQADELVALAQVRGVLLQAAHLERFNPAVQRAREIVTRPRFVEANRLGPFPGRGTDVDVVMDLMIHDLDLVLEFVGRPVQRVSARGVPVVSHEADIANARLEFDDGCVADLTASRISLKRERKMRVFQDNAYLSIDFAEPSVMIVRREPPATPEDWPQLTAEALPIVGHDALLAQVGAFVGTLLHGGPAAVSAHAGRRALEVALLIGEDIQRWRQT